ncbi:MAG: macro domain-containing protein [Nanobdellota archaeon]
MRINNRDYVVDSTAEAIAHGCNCKGIMGKGAALGIRRFYDDTMYREYLKRCELGLFTPGTLYSYREPDKPILYNLAIQNNPGKKAKLVHVQSCLEKLVEDLENHDIHTLGITPLGAHNGGLSQADVINCIRERFSGTSVDVTIYTASDQVPLKTPYRHLRLV